ncbi:MAG TPA: MraY family glycosyltransferase [Rhizomicrobium sp.]|nr:MraY family glycosyltransferase [Rhizomicrobium sp.]
MFVALIASLLILINARIIGEKLQVMDHPDTVRKKHAQVTPLVGGLAIMVPMVLWAVLSLIWNPSVDVRLLEVVLLCGAGATLVGYADDQTATSPSSRLLSLFLLSSIAMVIDPELIPAQLNWGNFEPTAIPAWFAFTFVAVAMAGYVNAVNWADGQNGIVTGLFAIWAACLMIVTGNGTAAIASAMFETVVVTFLFNMAGRVFLGDAGTYGVAFVFGVLAIRAHNHWGVTAETIAVWFFIPIMDSLRLIVARALQGQAPSDADSDHFHHRLQQRIGKTAGLCTYLGVVGVSSLTASVWPHLALVCMVVLAAFYFSFAWLTEVDARSDEAAGGGDVETDAKARPRLVAGKDAPVGRE